MITIITIIILPADLVQLRARLALLFLPRGLGLGVRREHVDLGVGGRGQPGVLFHQ